MDEQQKADFLAALREKPDQMGIWMHNMRGGISAIVSASLVIHETLAEREADPEIAEMLSVIDEKAAQLLDLIEVLGDYNRSKDEYPQG